MPGIPLGTEGEKIGKNSTVLELHSQGDRNLEKMLSVSTLGIDVLLLGYGIFHPEDPISHIIHQASPIGSLEITCSPPPRWVWHGQPLSRLHGSGSCTTFTLASPHPLLWTERRVPTPKFVFWTLTLKVMLFGDRGFGRWLVHEEEPTWMGLVPL